MEKRGGWGGGFHCESVPTKCPVSVKKVLLIKSSWVIKERLFPRRQFDFTPIAPAVSAPSPSIVLVYWGGGRGALFASRQKGVGVKLLQLTFFASFFFFFKAHTPRREHVTVASRQATTQKNICFKGVFFFNPNMGTRGALRWTVFTIFCNFFTHGFPPPPSYDPLHTGVVHRHRNRSVKSLPVSIFFSPLLLDRILGAHMLRRCPPPQKKKVIFTAFVFALI